MKSKLSFSDVKFKMFKDSCVAVQQVGANMALQDGGKSRSTL